MPTTLSGESVIFDEEAYKAPEAEEEAEKPTTEPKDFALENKSNMWDSIKTEPIAEPEPTADSDDEMDVPPSLRERLKKKKK